MNEEEKYYTIKMVDEYEFSEIDFDLYKELFQEDSEDLDITAIGDSYTRGYPIEINRLIQQLQKFQEAGATHVSMEYHEDHIGYPMEGLKIYESTQEEVQKYEESLQRDVEKERKIAFLKLEIEKLARGK
jgi:hypothetical protein